MTTKHTNGPWYTCGWNNLTVNTNSADNGIDSQGTVRSPCATILLMPAGSHDATLEELQANSRLIASAPELLQHSEQFLQWFRVFIGEESFAEIRCDELDNLQAALKAAKGE